jgi:hypothetical protein
MFVTDGFVGSTCAPAETASAPNVITAAVVVDATTARSRASRILPFSAFGGRPFSQETIGVIERARRFDLAVFPRSLEIGWPDPGSPCHQGGPRYHPHDNTSPRPGAPVTSAVAWEYQDDEP